MNACSFNLRQQRLLRRVAWLACFAVLLLALMPSVSRLLAASSNQIFAADICTTSASPQQVIAKAQLAGGQTPPIGKMPAGGSHLDHCPYCVVQAQAVVLPSVAAPPLLVSVSFQYAPPLFLHAAQRLHAWSSARPRAPPALA